MNVGLKRNQVEFIRDSLYTREPTRKRNVKLLNDGLVHRLKKVISEGEGFGRNDIYELFHDVISVIQLLVATLWSRNVDSWAFPKHGQRTPLLMSLRKADTKEFL